MDISFWQGGATGLSTAGCHDMYDSIRGSRGTLVSAFLGRLVTVFGQESTDHIAPQSRVLKMGNNNNNLQAFQLGVPES